MKHQALTGALLASALAFYAAGISGGGTVLLVLGLACECGFWLRLFQARKKPAQDRPASQA